MSLAAQEKALKDYVIPNEKFDSLNNVWIKEPIPFVEVDYERKNDTITGNKLLRFADVDILVGKDTCNPIISLPRSDEEVVYVVWNDSTLLYLNLSFVTKILYGKTYNLNLKNKMVACRSKNYFTLLIEYIGFSYPDGPLQSVQILSGDMLLLRHKKRPKSPIDNYRLVYFKKNKAYIYDL
ncbi:MAG: hypothetical protein IPL35_02650 [Sphingobacteriales bacterium]|nr:hypothetical protein [Sphingobacteriales bacterium]